ncbi:uncharacterized protein AMSG_08401 [Thecamonas trahens ATCC 50062]|uniref:Suppressor of fused-like domain-containing protein n=1 Tax=Thecamonas trahens ATCC 50062 TaxID=461836 RepID=A0A0L0DJ44_THETB|nr:hypothetical protein AMSG_08401 [Thecamonas trahens ATCC 50062]KNC52424.1 hypothetical protein AMSG_08401 [Thecamonas trahens ATCC 50062]|eukprot:XP_013755466.1 hypothetical protein AMSG_08401 [Thecamonas trahens ATCC 50062]
MTCTSLGVDTPKSFVVSALMARTEWTWLATMEMEDTAVAVAVAVAVVVVVVTATAMASPMTMVGDAEADPAFYIHKPNDLRPFYTLATEGMSYFAMDVIPEVGPVEVRRELERVEFMMYLPHDWVPAGHLGDELNESNWPFYAMRALCSWISQTRTWIGEGHTVPMYLDGTPAVPGSQLTHMLFLPPVLFEHPEFAFCKVDDQLSFNMLVIVPITKPEWELKRSGGLDALVPLLESGEIPTVVDIHRSSAV